MAINSTSNATSSSTTSTSGVGKGSVIDVEGLVSKLDSIEQAPIDKLNVKVTSQDNAISDLGVIKEKLSLFQGALQDFTDPFSYLSKSVSSSNSAVLGASVSNSTAVLAGVFNVNVTTLAKTSTATYGFNLTQAGSFTLQTTNSAGTTIAGTLQSFSFNASATLESVRDQINQKSSDTKVRAAIVNTGSGYVLSLTSTVGGADSQVKFLDTSTSPRATLIGSPQVGTNAVFTINGQEFTRTSNIVDEALPGVKLQLQGIGSASISAISDNNSKAQTLLTNLGQAYNDLIASYSELTKFNADPQKRGSLYGFTELRGMIDSISLSFMKPLTRSEADLTDNTGNAISLTSLGLEFQKDGTLLFKSNIYESAVAHGALDELANGSVSPTRALVNFEITSGGDMDSYIDGFTKQRYLLQNRVADLETRKTEKMARYRAQYASLDALLYRLQALNSSLTPTFTALNNQKNN
jgi:flagellar hook-associated protein 2